LYFTLASSDLVAEQDQVLTQLTTSFQTLFAAAQFIGYEVQVGVVGHTDGTGIAKKNGALGQLRAEQIMVELGGKGLTAEQVAVLQPRADEPLREESADQDLAASRSVTF
jgi:outer membrane protein OmpA-like peptidoglycan-associated protein